MTEVAKTRVNLLLEAFSQHGVSVKTSILPNASTMHLPVMSQHLSQQLGVIRKALHTVRSTSGLKLSLSLGSVGKIIFCAHYSSRI